MNEKSWQLFVLCLVTPILVGLITGCRSTKPGDACGGGLDGDGEYELLLCTDKEQYDYGSTVNVKLQLTNLSPGTLTFDGGENPVMDILEQDFRWSDEKDTSRVLTQLSLDTGEVYSISWDWPTPQVELDQRSLDSEYSWLHIAFGATLYTRPDHDPVTIGKWIMYHAGK